MNPYAKTLIFAIITFLGIFTHIGFDTHKKPYFKWILTGWVMLVTIAFALFSYAAK